MKLFQARSYTSSYSRTCQLCCVYFASRQGGHRIFKLEISVCIFSSAVWTILTGNHKAWNRHKIYASCSLRYDQSISAIPLFFYYIEIDCRAAHSFGATETVHYKNAEPKVDIRVINKYPTLFPKLIKP